MAPQRSATPVSVAAHSLYEQSDPYTVQEPEGRLDLRQARYEAIDDLRTRVSGAQWIEADARYIKLEGARRMGERAVLLCAAADRALHDEASPSNRRERADLFRDEHGMPQRQEEQRARGSFTPLGEQLRAQLRPAYQSQHHKGSQHGEDQ